MVFSADIVLKRGETIRFVLTNVGRAVHEINIGTDEIWDGHRNEMRVMVRQRMITARRINHDRMTAAGMMHNYANSALLEPGGTGELIWALTDAAEVGFACNIPGHREAGMVGSFDIGAPQNS